MNSTAALAYLGDAVFELRVREMLLAKNETTNAMNNLNRQARKYVSATAQAAMYHAVFPHLTEEEQAVMKRGRNLHSVSRAKNADAVAYRHATGLETLFGYLHENEAHERMQAIFAMCVACIEERNIK